MVETSYGEFYDIKGTGPVAQIPVPASVHGINVANTVAASGSVTSNLLQSSGHKVLAVGVTSTQTGAINIQRYLDAAGTVAQGAALTQALTASTAAVLNVTDGLPFMSFTVKITNTGASAATLSNLAILMQAS